MKNSRASIWLWLTLIYTASTFILSSLSISVRLMPARYHPDWIMHAIQYGILAFLLMKYAGASGHFRSIWFAYFSTLVFCGIVGAMNELLQDFIPHRYPSLADEVANLVGVVLALGIYALFHRKSSSNRNQTEN